MALGTRDVAQQRGKKLIAVGEQLDVGRLERQREALIDEKVDERLLLLWQPQVVLLDEAKHGAFGQLVHGTAADEALLARVDTEEQIEHDARNGYEIDDQRPSHGLHRLAIVHDHVDDGQHDNHLIDRKQYGRQQMHS